ncbi:MAG: hypothetical protein KDA67_05430 [Rhodobacteraceae bacterium]|nr:hypothetical protein [Paracoccaceae bacterium]
MDIWTLLEYAAWGLSAIFGLYIIIDWFKTDTTYSDEVLMSSREGALEAMTEEQHKH